MRVLLVLLVAALAATPAAAQQPNCDPVKLLVNILWVEVSYQQVGNNTLPGPHFVQLPAATSAPGLISLAIYGSTSQQYWVFAQSGPPTTGWGTFPGGIVDINPSQAFPVSMGTYLGNGMIIGGLNFPGTYPPFNHTFQGLVTDPTSPVGYTLTAAIHVVAQ